MKFKRNEKYASISFYAIITVIAAAVIALIFFKFSAIRSIFSKVTTVISPIIYGFVIAYICNPLVKFFENRVLKFKTKATGRSRIKRALAIILTFIVVFAAIAAFLLLLIPQISASYDALSAKMGDYIRGAQGIASDLTKKISDLVADHEGLGKIINVERISETSNRFLSNISTYLEAAASAIIKFLAGFISQMKNLLLGIFLSIYMLYSKEKTCSQFKKLLASLTSRKTYLNIVNLARFTDRAFGGFITGKILDSIIIGLLCFVVFGILGYNYYPLIALVIGVTNIVPIFGPLIGIVIMSIMLLITEPSKVILFIVVALIIQQLDGNVIGPKILGQKTGIAGMWVMISIIIGGGLLGFPGMILGVPTFAVIYSLTRQMSENKLRRRGAPYKTDTYRADPPEKDYRTEDVFIRRGEEVPDDMDFPEEIEEPLEEDIKQIAGRVGKKVKEKVQKIRKK
ncbi:MAG: AI-2E family transporter [Clostridia bacterium]|nr:AI-2E family transporter [Clostridia bacterium]